MKSISFFSAQLSRLKELLNVSEDQEVAAVLGMRKSAFSARKTRASFPKKELYALAAKRPELGLDVDYVLTGITRDARALLDAKQARIDRSVDIGLGVAQARALESEAAATLMEPAAAGCPASRNQGVATSQETYVEQAVLALWRMCSLQDRNLVMQLLTTLAAKRG